MLPVDPAQENKRRQSRMSAREYWNLPGSDDDDRFRVDYSGIWNPDFDKNDPNILRERANQRLAMQNLADGGNRRQASVVGGLDQLVESFTDAGEGGRKTAARFTGPSNPFSRVGQTSIRDDPDSTFYGTSGPFGVFGAGTGGNAARLNAASPAAAQGPFGAFGAGTGGQAAKLNAPSLDAAQRVQNRKKR